MWLGRAGTAAALQPLTAQRERPGRRSTEAGRVLSGSWTADCWAGTKAMPKRGRNTSTAASSASGGSEEELFLIDVSGLSLIPYWVTNVYQ